MILPADFRQVDGRLGILHSEILHRLGDDLRDGEIAEPLVKRYGLINDFEKMLVDAGVTILKFFLYISKEEQLERFKQRLDDPARNWKISESDDKEREYWDDYIAAFEDALSKCSTEHEPWRDEPQGCTVTRFQQPTPDGWSWCRPAWKSNGCFRRERNGVWCVRRSSSPL